MSGKTETCDTSKDDLAREGGIVEECHGVGVHQRNANVLRPEAAALALCLISKFCYTNFSDLESENPAECDHTSFCHDVMVWTCNSEFGFANRDKQM